MTLGWPEILGQNDAPIMLFLSSLEELSTERCMVLIRYRLTDLLDRRPRPYVSTQVPSIFRERKLFQGSDKPWRCWRAIAFAQTQSIFQYDPKQSTDFRRRSIYVEGDIASRKKSRISKDLQLSRNSESWNGTYWCNGRDVDRSRTRGGSYPMWETPWILWWNIIKLWLMQLLDWYDPRIRPPKTLKSMP